MVAGSAELPMLWQVWSNGRAAELHLADHGLVLQDGDERVHLAWESIRALDFATTYSVQIHTDGPTLALGFADRRECGRFADSLPDSTSLVIVNRPAGASRRLDAAGTV